MPGNSNLVIAQAAITPNTRLRLTEIAATVSVSRIAESASGSVSAEKYAPMPFENACANTTTSGSTTKTVRKVTAIAMMTARTSQGSVRVSAARKRSGWMLICPTFVIPGRHLAQARNRPRLV